MEFINLIGKRLYGCASAKDYTDWAEGLLLDNADENSENVAILAGIGLEKDPDSEEAEFYFQKSLKDLGLTIPDKQTVLNDYASYLCKQLINKEIESETAVELLQGLHFYSDYEPIYSIWHEISDDLWAINNNDQAYINTIMTKHNKDEFLAEVARQFIVLLKLKLPDNFYKLSVCTECGYIGESTTRERNTPAFSNGFVKMLPDMILRLFPVEHVREATCAKCLKPFPKTMSDVVAREFFIKSQ